MREGANENWPSSACLLLVDSKTARKKTGEVDREKSK